jgi:hypothetical protein
VPSKRQPSKQRRAAQNRARSQSLAARSVNAQQSGPVSSGSTASSGGGSTSTPPRRGGFLSNLLAPPQQSQQQAATGGPTEVVGNPGRSAVIVALVISVGLAVAVLFFIPQPVDDRGDAVPPFFGGLYLRARDALGGSVETTNESGISAGGGAAVAVALLPVLICAGALAVYLRRRANGQSLYWPMTIAMIVMALVVMMLQYSFAMPAMVALAVASFQVRKAEMPGRMADQVAARQARRSEPEPEPEPEDEYEDEEYEDEDYDEEDVLEDDEIEDETPADDDTEPPKEK